MIGQLEDTWLDHTELNKLELLEKNMYPIHQLEGLVPATYYTARVREWYTLAGVVTTIWYRDSEEGIVFRLLPGGHDGGGTLSKQVVHIRL